MKKYLLSLLLLTACGSKQDCDNPCPQPQQTEAPGPTAVVYVENREALVCAKENIHQIIFDKSEELYYQCKENGEWKQIEF